METVVSGENDVPSGLAEEYLKLYSLVVDFKQNVTEIFKEKGLIEESSELDALETVTMETQGETVLEADQLSENTLLVFQLMTELIRSLSARKVGRSVTARVEHKEAQTIQTSDISSLIMNASLMPLALVKEEVNDEHLDLSHLPSSARTRAGTNRITVSLSPDTPVRKSSRASVLNRKSFASPTRIQSPNPKSKPSASPTASRGRGRPRIVSMAESVEEVSDSMQADDDEEDGEEEEEEEEEDEEWTEEEGKSKRFGKRASIGLVARMIDGKMTVTKKEPVWLLGNERALRQQGAKLLASHMYERTSDGQFRCKECGKVARLQTNIRKHLRKHTGEKPYCCAQCPATFAYPRSLKRHELVHEGRRPYVCLTCDKGFFDVTSLKAHSLTHTSIRAHVCFTCGDRFRTKEGLKGHMRRHTGDRPFVCEICGQSFSIKRSLTRHIRVHTGERPYQCDQCVACFADWTTLHNHKLVHREAAPAPAPDPAEGQGQDPAEGQGEEGKAKDPGVEVKPFQCQFCGVRYRQPLSLKRHIRLHTADMNARKKMAEQQKKKLKGENREGEQAPALHKNYRPYKCDLCGSNFKHLRGFETHKLKHEKGKIEKDGKKPVPRRQKKMNDLEQAASILVSAMANDGNRTATISSPTVFPVSMFRNQPQTSSATVTVIDPSGALPTFTSNLALTSGMQGVILDTTGSNVINSIAGGHMSGEIIQGEEQQQVVHFDPGQNVTRIYRYPDGTYREVTSLVQQQQPTQQPIQIGSQQPIQIGSQQGIQIGTSRAADGSSSLMVHGRPVTTLLDNSVVTVVFESGDNVVIDNSGDSNVVVTSGV